jgi:hypothetical protein
MTATIALVVGVSSLGLLLTAGAIVAKRRATRLVALAPLANVAIARPGESVRDLVSCDAG